MFAFLLNEDRGTAAIDWVILTAGIALLGGVVAYSVLGNSQNRLQDAFDQLNRETANASGKLTAIERSIDFAGPAEKALDPNSSAYESDPRQPETRR